MWPVALGSSRTSRPQPPRQARSPGVTAVQAHLDAGAIVQRAVQPRAAVAGQRTDCRALTPEPGHEFGRPRQDRRRAEQPAHQPSGRHPAEEHQHHGERGQDVYGQAADQQCHNRARPPARPVRTPGQIGPHHERDERRVHDEYEGTAAVQHGMLDCAVLGPPHGRRGHGRRGAGDPRGRRVARVLPLAAYQHHQGDDRQSGTGYAGHDFGPERQPARDVMHPGRHVVGQLSAAERKSPDRADHQRDDRERKHREEQVGRAAHPAGGVLHAGSGRAGRLVPRACRHGIGATRRHARHPPRRPEIAPNLAASRDHGLPGGGRWALHPSARTLRPSIFRLVLPPPHR